MEGILITIGITIFVLYILKKASDEPTKPYYPVQEVHAPKPPKRELEPWKFSAPIPTVDYEIYIKSEDWLRSQPRVLTLVRDNNCCIMCGEEEELEVHHITYDNLGKEKLDDLATLCHECHKHTHKVAGKGAMVYMPQKSPLRN